MSTVLIKVTCFENLQVTNIIVLNAHLISENVSTKSNASVKEGTSRDFIDYRDS